MSTPAEHSWRNHVQPAVKNDVGASAVEYALLVACVAAVVVLAVLVLGATASHLLGEPCAELVSAGRQC